VTILCSLVFLFVFYFIFCLSFSFLFSYFMFFRSYRLSTTFFPYTTLFRSQGREPLRLADDIRLHILEIRRVVIRGAPRIAAVVRSEEHTSELQSLAYLVCRLLLEKKNAKTDIVYRLLLEKKNKKLTINYKT